MTLVASLGMYDAPSLHTANDQLWAATADRLDRLGLGHVPTSLDRTRTLEEIWVDPDLLLAQTCGYPLVTRLKHRVRLVCTPLYVAEGCEGPRHRAAVIVRGDDPARSLRNLRGARCAVNEGTSNTGYNLLRQSVAEAAEGGAFLGSPPLVTGSHAHSLAAVVAGRADFASVDGVTLAHLREDEPDLVSGIRVLCWTAATPTPPLITSLNTSPDKVATLRRALTEALDDVGADTRRRLRLTGFTALSIDDYGVLMDAERAAGDLGYPKLQ